MSSDKHDKTVFRQSGGNPDRTVIRPAPGGRRKQPAMSNDAAMDRPASKSATTRYQSQQETPVQTPVNINPLDGGVFAGMNPMVDAASTLIAVFQKTRQSVSHRDVGGLHQRLTGEIKQFENSLKMIGFKPEVILSARYCVCTVLDEAVLNTPWGSESGWSQRTLLSIFHNETAGGEKFFQILERMKEYPADNIEILELLYVFISLGFEGKYRVAHRGRDAIEQLRDELFSSIRMIRGEYERSLSPTWQGVGNVRNSMTRYIPFWVVASVLGVVLVLSYSGLRFWLLENSSPVVAELEQIAASKPVNSN